MDYFTQRDGSQTTSLRRLSEQFCKLREVPMENDIHGRRRADQAVSDGQSGSRCHTQSRSFRHATCNFPWEQRHVLTVALLLCPILWVMSAAPSIAQSRGLEGYWRGSGFIKVKDAPKERVRCRVTYSRRSSNTYSVDAKCASQGANITQSGQVAKTGRNRYAGKFYNSDYNVRGRIRITIRGNRQYVTLRSEAGSGNLMLFRR